MVARELTMKPVTLNPPPTAPPRHAAPAAPTASDAAWPGLVSLAMVLLVALALLLAVSAQRGPGEVRAAAASVVSQPVAD